MPHRPPLKRLAAELALSDEALTVLRDMATALEVPEDRWDQSPSFAFLWGSYAVAKRAASLQKIRGLSHEAAQADASVELGLSGDTTKTRRRRFRDDARGV